MSTIAILTGDIINSRQELTTAWQPALREVLGQYGTEPGDWELFRGDSFQLQTTPEQALWAAIHIKACLRQLPPLDARIAIGLGEAEYRDQRLTASTGTAFARSGEAFDALKKQTMMLRSGQESADDIMNIMLALALLTMNGWSNTVATVIRACMEHPRQSQIEIAAMLQKSQSSISEALKRGGFDEVKQMDFLYRKLIHHA